MPSRTAIATAAVIAGLGGLATAALTARPGGGTTVAATAPAPRPIVRTTTEVHTIVRVRRDLPPQPRPAAAAAPPPAAAPAAAPAPVAQEAPASQPLRTRASGAGSGERADDVAEHGEGEGHERDD
jgi:type IV secretory pathway VirB10-like protein